MATAILLLLSLPVALCQSPSASPSGASQSYINSVCSPNITDAGAPVPPCISITTIQTQCAPNGTSPLDYLASAECMCNPPSSFFSDWLGCQQCLFVHGARSANDLDTYSAIIGSASRALCTGTPTADFAAIFSSVAATVAPVTSAGSVLSDRFPGQTAVSLYYTATGSQGPGAITGSATAATGSGGHSGAKTTAAGGGSSGGSAATAMGGSAGSATAGSGSSSSQSGAAPTAALLPGAMLAAAGGMAMAVL